MNKTELVREIDQFIDQNREAILRDLKVLVDIDSVQTAPEPGSPFGAGPHKALAAALAMARGMGLETRDCEGYMGYAELPGKSAAQIATIAHLDVVPAGNGWNSDPFQMEIRDGYAIGRGVADDKGPAVLTLYAGKFFRERGEALPYTLRLLLGCSEETGMADVDYYLAHYPQPAFCFTPDGEFPVCCGEKGGYGGVLRSAPLHGNLVDLEGGVAPNAVPDRAWALVRADASLLPDTANVKVTAEQGFACITGYGVSGHASTPQGTVNAIALVVDYLLAHKLCTAEEDRWLQFMHTALCVTDGSTLGIAARDEAFTPLTCIGGTVSMRDGAIRQTIDIRYPTTITAAQMREKISALAAAAGGSFEPVKRVKTPFSINPETPVIRTLIDTYNEVTGRSKKPFTMGGGTYACHFAHAVSFGMEEADLQNPAWVGAMHGANEGVSLELLFTSLKIYILALARLMELPF